LLRRCAPRNDSKYAPRLHGNAEFAVPTLDALLAAGHEVVAVYSQPPRPAGRGKGLRPSPVQQRAEAAGIDVRAPLSLRDAAEQEAFAALGLDAAVVAAYGLILPVPILEAPRYGCLNVTARCCRAGGAAAPIQRAILRGDEERASIMEMERGLDTAGHAAVRRARGGKRARELTAELAEWRGDDGRCWSRWRAEASPAGGGVHYAHKIEKHEARLDFTLRGEVERQVGLHPVPGASLICRGAHKDSCAESSEGRSGNGAR
jgi:methionyl-tRNA formyltransferase